MRVFIERTNEHIEVKATTLKDMLKELKINPTTVIITKNSELVTEDEEINNKDEIKFLSVISGG